MPRAFCLHAFAMSLLRATHLPTPCACPTLLIVLAMWRAGVRVRECHVSVCVRACVRVRVCLGVFAYVCTCAILRACVCVYLRVRAYVCACVCVLECHVSVCMHVCGCVPARGPVGMRVSVCVFPFYLQYVDRNKCHGLSLTTSGVRSCLFGYGTSRSNAVMFQTSTYMGVCMRICMCVCPGACLHRCMYMSHTHNTHIHAHTTHTLV